MKHFDKIYYINLDSETGRDEIVKKQFELIGINPERVSAVPGKSIDIDAYEIKETEGWNRNAIGLILTTAKILEDAIKNKYDSIFIFEDDSYMSNHFGYIYDQFMSEVPSDWEFIQLNTNDRISVKYVSKFVRRLEDSTCCQAYGIRKSVFKDYLDRILTITKPIDEHTVDIQKNGKCYSPVVNPVTHIRGLHSTLREKKVDY